MRVGVLSMHMFVHHLCAWGPWRPTLYQKFMGGFRYDPVREISLRKWWTCVYMGELSENQKPKKIVKISLRSSMEKMGSEEDWEADYLIG